MFYTSRRVEPYLWIVHPTLENFLWLSEARWHCRFWIKMPFEFEISRSKIWSKKHFFDKNLVVLSGFRDVTHALWDVFESPKMFQSNFKARKLCKVHKRQNKAFLARIFEIQNLVKNIFFNQKLSSNIWFQNYCTNVFGCIWAPQKFWEWI